MRLYNILFPVLFLLAAPFLLLETRAARELARGLAQRFGAYGELTEQLKNQRVIWLHAVSVGEANLAVQLVDVCRLLIQSQSMWFPPQRPPAWAYCSGVCRRE